jgi:serine/threonine-protein kinase
MMMTKAREYKKLKILGEGGNSTVYLVKDIANGELMTLKTPKIRDGEEDIHSIKSFENEARILSLLEHEAIPHFYGKVGSGIMLEHFEGESLEKKLMTNGVFSEKEAVRIALELADILRYLHGKRQPVIYRDLKPSNIVMKPDGHIALIDFGAARIYSRESKSDTVNLGTYGFAAPEQFGNLGQTDPRTDIYCFGMTLLQLISGVDTKDSEEVMRFKQNGVAGVSPELMGIIDKCTRPDRNDRFHSMMEIQEALRKYPGAVKRRKTLAIFKMTLVASVISVVVSFGVMHIETVKAYAATDIEERMPAVQQRLYNAKLWILEHVDFLEGKE